MPSTLNEKSLLYRIQNESDPDAYAPLYDKYVKQIYRFVYFKVGGHEEAEDITSEVFLKAWNYLRDSKEIKSFSGLLYRIARNCIIDSYRQKSAKPESLSITEDTDAGDSGNWYTQVNVNLEAEKIVQSLKKLKQEYQEVLTLRFIDELEITEIAEITGKGQISVRVTIHRALQKLKKIIAAEQKII